MRNSIVPTLDSPGAASWRSGRAPLAAALLLLNLAAPAGAKERDPLEAWADEEAEWIITKDESKRWKSLESAADREAFIALFWARRDPTPGTSRNEFREQYLRRLTHADEHYSSARQEGRHSDRGRVHCLLGPPNKEGTFQLPGPKGRSAGNDDPASMSGAPSSIGGGMRGSLPPVLWTYNDLPDAYGIPSLEVRFVDYEGFGTYALDSGGPAAAALKKAVDLAITQPGLTSAPPMVADEAPAPPDAAPPEAAPAPPEEPAPAAVPLDPAVAALLARADRGKGTVAVAAEAAVFQGSDGRPFVPIAVGTLAAAPPGAVAFYRVTSGGGTVAEGSDSTVPFLRTLDLAPGTFELEAGIVAGTTHGIVKRTIVVPGPSSGLGVSSIVLSRKTDTLAAPAGEHEPFTFGQVRVEPQLGGVFQKGDELMIFVAAYHVGDQPGPPKVLASFAFDKNGKFWNEIPEAEQQLVKLSAGRYLVTQILPLARFAPATYKLKVTVKDASAAGSTASAEASFTVK